MTKKAEYIKKISERGDRFGGGGGLLDMLTWCDKKGVMEVTEEEARLFLQNPDIPYSEAMDKLKGQ